MNKDSLTYKMKSWIEKLTADIDADKSIVLNKLKDFPGNQEIARIAVDDIERLPGQEEIVKTVIDFLEWYSTGKITGIKVMKNESKSK